MIRLLTALGLLAFGVAHAAEFSVVQIDKSSITFVTKQMNVPIDGAFHKFAAQISLDPAKPQAGRANIEIDIASIDTGFAQASYEAQGKNWFDAERFPKATYASSTIKALGGDRYEAAGKMTMKGKALELRVPFTARQDKGVLEVDGTFPLKRLDYGIGAGDWADTSVLADEVQVKFHLVVGPGKEPVAAPAPTAPTRKKKTP